MGRHRLKWRWEVDLSMRALILSLACAALGACSGEPGADSGTAQAATTSSASVLMGQYRASSDTARAAGDVVVEHAGLVFDRGAVLYTRILNPRRPDERIARDGESYAVAALSAASTSIELRRVTDQTLANGAPSLCAGETPAYVALVYGERAAHMTVLVFAGDEPPGPTATRTRLCAALPYVARDGTGTPQGVVLW
jgi:hypothetical protein